MLENGAEVFRNLSKTDLLSTATVVVRSATDLNASRKVEL